MNSSPPYSSNQDDSRQPRTVNRGVNSVHVASGTPPPSLTVGDIYYALFRHKWRILICVLAGVVAAAVAYLLNPPPYRSESKLFIRYVFVDEGTSAARGQESQVKTPDQRGETIMDSESEILTSLDLARQVAEVVGPEKILAKAGGGNDLARAASVVHQGLVVDIPQRSSVIHVTFYHPDAQVVQPVLREVVRQYYKMHLTIHQAVGIVGDFLTQETDQLRAKLTQTEEELHKATVKAGVNNFDEARKNYGDEMARIRTGIYIASAEFAERKSVFDELAKRYANPTEAPVGEAPVPPEKVSEYRSLNTRLEMLKKREQDLLAEFTPESPRVANFHTLVAETEINRQKLLTEFPRLDKSAGTAANPQAPAIDLSALAAQLVSTQSKIEELKKQFEQVKMEASKLEESAGAVEDLKRRKDLEEANYRYYAARLEQSRINEALGAGKVSNITEIQTPSPAATDGKKSVKLIGGILFGALALGIGWSFFIELYLDRSVRRPIDLERMFGLPLFLSVPALDRRERRRLKAARDDLMPPPEDSAHGNTSGAIVRANGAEISDSTLLYSFHETLRDRLIGYFESRGLTHKPKLVAVTGLGRGSGVTTTATGLASSLSQTGEGNVLLVDMTLGQGSAQHFYHGEKIFGLEEILSLPPTEGKPRGTAAQVQDHLYVVGEEPGQEKLSRILPQRFTKLVPKLKASNFDYIIFDMPPVSQISITPRLAGFMDMVLLVVESEKTDRELVQRATSLLAQSKAHVGAVLNKSRTYVPSALHQEYLGNG